MVMRPLLFRPARSRPFATSDFCGRFRVSSSNPDTLEPRRPGVVGLYFLTAMFLQLLSAPSYDGVLRPGASHVPSLRSECCAPGPHAHLVSKISIWSPAARVTMARFWS